MNRNLISEILACGVPWPAMVRSFQMYHSHTSMVDLGGAGGAKASPWIS